MAKYNNKSEFFKDWTTKKLKEEFFSLDELINKIECYGISEIRMQSGIAIELIKRGVEIKSEITFN